jgi:hypothetical protein
VAGRPSGTTYQSAENLERGRNEIYGQILVPVQHAEIASWRVDSPGWWLDPVRVDRVLAVRRSMAEALALLPDPREVSEADQALRNDDHLFGFRIGMEVGAGGFDGGIGPAQVERYTVEYTAATRPDLYLLHEALAGLMTSIQALNRDDPPAAVRLFYTMFPHLSVFGNFTDQPELVLFLAAVDDYLTALFFDARLTVHDYYAPIATAHDANSFNDYGLANALAYRHEIARLEVESHVRAGQAFLDGLAGDMENALVQYLVKTYIPSLHSLIVYASHSTELGRIDDLRKGVQ